MTEPHVAVLSQVQQFLDRQHGLYIDGRPGPAQSEKRLAIFDPATGQEIASTADANEADVDNAVMSAWRAFVSRRWAGRLPAERERILLRFSDLVEQHSEELAQLETLEQGKSIAISRAFEVGCTLNWMRYTAGLTTKISGRTLDVSIPFPQGARYQAWTRKEPVGVVAGIVPWNFPLMMACWKLGPALSTGNSVILKPSDKSPLTAIRIAALAVEAGIPAGVLNVLPGYGHTVGKALALHMDVDTLVFTGSTKIAKQLMIYSGESNMKRIWLEAGGKSPNIVFADAPDLQAAAESAASAIAFNQGEVCTAGSRLLVERSIKDKFLPLVIEALKAWKPGNPLDPATTVGALVDTQQMNTVLSYIESGHSEGAKLVAGGNRILQETGGTYVEPTIFDGVSNAMKIAQEEIFGPVLSVISFDTAAEAIQIANDTPYGLAAAVWTADISKAHLTAKALHAGSVWVNQYDGGDMTAPFGGFKQSGNGRDKSLHAFDKYTELKSTWIKL